MKLTAMEYHRGTVHPGGNLFNPALSWDPRHRPPRFKHYRGGNRVQLPEPTRELGQSTWDALGSPPHGDLKGGIASLEQMSTLLHYSNGVTKHLQGPLGRLPFRAAACTGALYHIEIYVVTAGFEGLPSGVYYFDPEAHALVQVSAGDQRSSLASATGDLASVGQSSASLVLTDVYWRNAVKYQAREYRHAWWDLGTVLANGLAILGGTGGPRVIVLGLLESQIEALLEIEGEPEFPLAVLPVGRPMPGDGADRGAGGGAVFEGPGRFNRRYPALEAIHESVRLGQLSDLEAWRREVADMDARFRPEGSPDLALRLDEQNGEDLLRVIRRRGSTRRFSRQPMHRNELQTLLKVATYPAARTEMSTRLGSQLTTPYLIVNAVDGLPAGSYRWDSGLVEQRRSKLDDLRLQAAELALGQSLGGDAAVNIYFLVDLASIVEAVGDRGYRLAQLDASLAAGRIYLASYALGLGATGLTFFDGAVIDFFSPPAGVEQVMFLIAVGYPDY